MIRTYLVPAFMPVVVFGIVASSFGKDPAALSIVVDCSKSMDHSLAMFSNDPQASRHLSLSRFEATMRVVESALSTLAAEGDHHVGLWLSGHRVAWEDADSPQLLEQSDYLAQTNGFAVLRDLVPGDDVELVRHVRTFDASHLPQLVTQLRAVKPWGESPMYLALSRAIDEFGAQTQNPQKGIILFTDGGNEQYMPRNPRTLEDVIKQHYRRRVPVYIIGLDLSTENHSEAIAEWREIARRTKGSFRNVKECGQLEAAFVDAVRAIETGVPADDEELVEDSAPTGSVPALPVASGRAVRPSKSAIEGVVLFRGQPVKNATVKTVGTTSRTVKSGADGTFTIEGVVPGEYELLVEGIAKNKIREASYKVVVQSPPHVAAYVEADLD